MRSKVHYISIYRNIVAIPNIDITFAILPSIEQRLKRKQQLKHECLDQGLHLKS